MKIKFKFIFSLLQVQQLTDIANFKLMIPSLNDGFGIAFESGYDKCLAEDLGLTYDSLVLKAEHKASEYAELYPEYDVIFVKDAIVWSDGSSESAILIFLPWNVDRDKFDEVGKHFGTTCYTMDPQNSDASEIIDM